MRFRRWRGAIVGLAWALSPILWLWSNLTPDQCAADDCGPHHWWDTPVFFVEIFALGLAATTVWLYWRRRRDRAV